MQDIFELGVADAKSLTEAQAASLSKGDVRDLPLARVKNAEDLHDAFASVLRLPAWYGKNLDAFWDLITDLPDDARIIVRVREEDWDALTFSKGFEDLFKKSVGSRDGVGYGRGRILLWKV